MADLKISQLTSVSQANIASTNDVLPIVNAGATKKATAYAITYSSLNASVATTFAYDATPTVGARIGVQGTGTSWIFNTPSGNPNYASGLVVDGTYDSGTFQSEINLRALGIYSGGGYGSELSLWTSNGTAITRQITIKNSGDVQVKTGNIVPNTAAKGVNFTANTPAAGMTSQLLNWYEEGTWTPTDASGAGLTLTTSKTVYTRVGNVVTITGIVTYPSTASTALAIIGGLPFTSKTGSTGFFPGVTNASLDIVGNLADGTATFYLSQPQTTNARTNANMSTYLFAFSGSYIAA
jgi:hypothetical protein